MARYFNTSGPNDPRQHYTLPRPRLLEEGRRLVEGSRYFTIFAPRQSGKSTYFLLLCEELRRTGWLPLWMNFEAFHVKDEVAFFSDLDEQLRQALQRERIEHAEAVASFGDLMALLKRRVADRSGQARLALIVDEIEGLTHPGLLNDFLHRLREAYHSRDSHALKSVILCGVSNITGILESTASPFNVADQLAVPYFSIEEVRELLGQHSAETGQEFAPEVASQIHHFTQGQPGLVNGFACRLVGHDCPDGKRVQLPHFYDSLDWYTTEAVDKNLKNVISKALQRPGMVAKLLFGKTDVVFTTDDPDLEFLWVHGIIRRDVDGMAAIRLPLYKTRLLARFRAEVNGEARRFLRPLEAPGQLLTPEGEVAVDKLLLSFRDYVRETGFRAFDLRDEVREAAGQLSLDGYLSSVVRHILGGFTQLEAPAGRGRVDVMIVHQGRRYLIETKVRRSELQIKQGKTQAAEYARALGLDRVWYVVFADDATDEELTAPPREELMDGLALRMLVVPYEPPVPSRSSRTRRSARRRGP